MSPASQTPTRALPQRAPCHAMPCRRPAARVRKCASNPRTPTRRAGVERGGWIYGPRTPRAAGRDKRWRCATHTLSDVRPEAPPTSPSASFSFSASALAYIAAERCSCKNMYSSLSMTPLPSRSTRRLHECGRRTPKKMNYLTLILGTRGRNWPHQSNSRRHVPQRNIIATLSCLGMDVSLYM